MLSKSDLMTVCELQHERKTTLLFISRQNELYTYFSQHVQLPFNLRACRLPFIFEYIRTRSIITIVIVNFFFFFILFSEPTNNIAFIIRSVRKTHSQSVSVTVTCLAATLRTAAAVGMSVRVRRRRVRTDSSVGRNRLISD